MALNSYPFTPVAAIYSSHSRSWRRRQARGGLVPAMELNFLSGEMPQPVAGLTFTRSSTATYINAAGVMAQAGINAPRFDFDPMTLQPLGLLIEGQSTNQIPANTVAPVLGDWPQTPASGGTTVYSVVNDAAALTAAGLTLGTTVLKVDNTAGVGAAYISSEAAAATGGLCVASAYLRATGANAADVRISADWASTTNPAPLAGGGGYVRRATQPSTPPGANAHRLSVEVPAGCIVYVALAQYELASDASSYIPTYGSAATRAGETCTMPLGAWYNNAAGTVAMSIYKQAWVNVGGGNRGLAVFSANESWSNSIQLVYPGNVSTGQVNFENYRAGAGSATNVGAFVTAGACRVAASWGASAPVVSLRGAPVVAAPAYVLPIGANLLELGTNGGNINHINGHLRSFAYYPVALPNATLQALSA